MLPRLKVIACAAVIEEILPLVPPDVAYQILDFGLHVSPNRLRSALQAAIDESTGQCDAIVLGYGLCAQAIVGLRATGCTLVVPRVDDCIAIFLGSTGSYQQQLRAEPGTYYLTKVWIEVGSSPFAEYDRLLASYGRERADRIIGIMLRHYKRLAFINTGQHDLESYRAYARRTAERFGLHYEEIRGSTALVKKALYGPWDDDFFVVPPGGTITYSHFHPAMDQGG